MLEPGALRFRAAAYDVGRSNFPARWAERWIGANLSGEPILSNASIREVEERLHAWRITPAGTEGYAKAEVTAGGVDTSELDAKTMQARAVPGLFFIGEVVDVTGWLGGYNFQWAWASGFCAGQVA
jgi:predicted flavoprotein YhiN